MLAQELFHAIVVAEDICAGEQVVELGGEFNGNRQEFTGLLIEQVRIRGEQCSALVPIFERLSSCEVDEQGQCCLARIVGCGRSLNEIG